MRNGTRNYPSFLLSWPPYLADDSHWPNLTHEGIHGSGRYIENNFAEHRSGRAENGSGDNWPHTWLSLMLNWYEDHMNVIGLT